MRTETLLEEDMHREKELQKDQHLTRYRVQERCPWASVITKVGGGYIAFESVDDYQTFLRQK